MCILSASFVVGYAASSTPNHHHVRRKRAAHVEGQHALHAVNLIFARRAGELAKNLRHLSHPGRADGMAVSNQATAGVHRQAAITNTCGLPIADFQFVAHAGQSRRATLQ